MKIVFNSEEMLGYTHTKIIADVIIEEAQADLERHQYFFDISSEMLIQENCYIDSNKVDLLKFSNTHGIITSEGKTIPAQWRLELFMLTFESTQLPGTFNTIIRNGLIVIH